MRSFADAHRSQAAELARAWAKYRQVEGVVSPGKSWKPRVSGRLVEFRHGKGRTNNRSEFFKTESLGHLQQFPGKPDKHINVWLPSTVFHQNP